MGLSINTPSSSANEYQECCWLPTSVPFATQTRLDGVSPRSSRCTSFLRENFPSTARRKRFDRLFPSSGGRSNVPTLSRRCAVGSHQKQFGAATSGAAYCSRSEGIVKTFLLMQLIAGYPPILTNLVPPLTYMNIHSTYSSDLLADKPFVTFHSFKQGVENG